MSDAESRGTILVVDDEPEVRKLVCAMVSHFGYTALAASRGEAALSIYNKHRNIDLLITDVIVSPGMSGPVLADRLAALQPGLKVLFISGYCNSRGVQQFVVDQGRALLNKPFTVRELEASIQGLLAPAVKTSVG